MDSAFEGCLHQQLLREAFRHLPEHSRVVRVQHDAVSEQRSPLDTSSSCTRSRHHLDGIRELGCCSGDIRGLSGLEYWSDGASHAAGRMAMNSLPPEPALPARLTVLA